METIIRSIRDISPPDKLALEHVVGQSLADNQKVIIQICNSEFPAEITPAKQEVQISLPEWCDVYAGLADEQIEAIEQTILQRAELTRAVG